jgi:hypothetical protein
MTKEILQNQVSDDSHIAPLSKNYMVQVKDFLQKWLCFSETYRNKLYINFWKVLQRSILQVALMLWSFYNLCIELDSEVDQFYYCEEPHFLKVGCSYESLIESCTTATLLSKVHVPCFP